MKFILDTNGLTPFYIDRSSQFHSRWITFVPTMDKIIKDKEFGEITLHISMRAKRNIVKEKEGKLILVMPYGGDINTLMQFFEMNRDKIRSIMKSRASVFHRREVHTMLELMMIIDSANNELPARLEQLAKQHSFHYHHLRISNTRSRWGSCSSNKDINLTFSLVILPDHLRDYVLLHELCHTIEMNHSPRFWELLNRVTDHHAFEYREELKTYDMVSINIATDQ